MSSQFLIVTHKHGLTPFANRLRNEGHEVDVLIWKERFQRAWDGKFMEVSREHGAPSAEALETLGKTHPQIVLTDYAGELELEAEQTYSLGAQEAISPLRLGAWNTSDGELIAPHMMVYDMGVWPGGAGLYKAAGATLIHLEGNAGEMAKELLTESILESHSGLLEVDVQTDPEGDLTLGSMSWGWSWLQSHCFLAGLENFGGVLTGEAPSFLAGSKFSTAIPVSIPPWPEFGRPAEEREIGPLPPQIRSHVFWHDVSLNMESKTMRTAGLDGLVGVAHGSAGQPGVALARALQVANSIDVAEKQWRPDVGQQVQAVLEAFELNYGLVL